jgi:hypothetical protein
MFNVRRLTIALGAAMTLAAGAAQAIGDIQVVNGSSSLIHPYFKSNCWNPEFVATPDPGTWVFFGGIGAHGQFTWNDFYLLLDPKCKNAVVKFTYALPGEDAPHETVVERTVLMQYDATENHRITLGDHVVVTGDAPY